VTFWIVAVIVLAIAAFITFLPLFRPSSYWTPIALALVFLLPASGLMLYPYIGTPTALDQVAKTGSTGRANEDPDIESMVASLRAKLTQSPEHLEGWLLLSKTLKSMQRYPEALEALEIAFNIAPDDPYVAVELVEARIYVSGKGEINEDLVSVLKEAVERDPGQQKGLWLLAIAASQSGDDAAAIKYWKTLQQQLDPGDSVDQRVQELISQAQTRPGVEPAPGAGAQERITEVGNEPGRIKVRLSASDELLANMPSNSVLYIIVRSSENRPGPPLGVRRIESPSLPLELTITDQDSMMADRKISSEPELKLQARLSLSGAPSAQSGDWQSAPIFVAQKTTQTVQLIMDHRVD